MHKAAQKGGKKANANKHHDEAIHLSNKKFIKSKDESRMLQWLFSFLVFPHREAFVLSSERSLRNWHFIEVGKGENVGVG